MRDIHLINRSIASVFISASGFSRSPSFDQNVSHQSHFQFAFFKRAQCMACSFLVLLILGSGAFAQNVQDTSKNSDKKVSLDVRVDPASLGLNLVIQIGNYAQRRAALPVTLRYNSKVWNIQYASSYMDLNLGYLVTTAAPSYENGWKTSLDAPNIEFMDQDAFDTYGNRVALDDVENGDWYWVVPRIYVRLQDGTRHELRRGDWIYTLQKASSTNPNLWVGEFFSVDGSGIRYDTATSTLYLPDGSRYVGNIYIDKSGNRRTLSSNVWTDNLGRTFTNPIPAPPTTGQDLNYSLPGLGTETQDFTFKWRDLEDVLTTNASLRYYGNCIYYATPLSPSLFQGTTQPSEADVCRPEIFNPVVLHEIVLPDNRSYKFTYNVYGEIDKVVYPTGSYERFQYDRVQPISFAGVPYSQANRGVTDRWVSSDGTSSSEVHWQYSASVDGTSISTIDPSGIKSERTYQHATSVPTFGFEDAKVGNLLDEKLYDVNQNLIKRSLFTYDTTGPIGTPPLTGSTHSSANRDVRPTREIQIVLEPGSSNALAMMTETVYDTSGSSDPAHFPR